MTNKNYFKHACPIAQSMGVLGSQWTLLIARDLINGINNFDKIQKNLEISRNLLTQRLKEMEKEGLTRKVIPDGLRRAIYKPTKKCFDLVNVMIALIEWSEKWDPDPTGPRVSILSKADGKDLKLALVNKEEAKALSEQFPEITYNSSSRTKGASGEQQYKF